uniref:Predicted oxidoreductase n=1 Tax=Candidatus Kentrum sp. SD TaxID=2126332 RepID=A0A451BKC9_9GAMM|nr:MAG: Predicted oxidoreductase [Candidatus Kentron sp. SD]
MKKENLQLSPVIMGTWQIDKRYWTGVEERGIIHAVHGALDAGVTTFDTAEDYGDGYSERLLGRALGPKRQEAMILSKVSSSHLRGDRVFEACHRSLANLGTDYLDLYQIHWPGGSWGSEPTPMEETMEALLRLREEGKIRAIGVSNFSLQGLKEAALHGEIFSLQPPYSLFWRHIDQEIRGYCEENHIRILAYSPLAQGLLTGRFGKNHQFEEGDNRREAILFQGPHMARAQKALAALRPLAERLGLSLGQLAIAWVIHRPLTHAITGVRDAAQITHNAAAIGVRLEKEDLALLDEITRPVSDPLLEKAIPWTWAPSSP